jgi:predicted transcriptional regulator
MGEMKKPDEMVDRLKKLAEKMDKKKKPTIGIQLEREQYEELKKFADADRRSMGFMIRDAVGLYLQVLRHKAATKTDFPMVFPTPPKEEEKP